MTQVEALGRGERVEVRCVRGLRVGNELEVYARPRPGWKESSKSEDVEVVAVAHDGGKMAWVTLEVVA